jgi:predicted RecB family nuclease
MRLRGTDVALSATDLANFLACRHRTALDLAVAHGSLKREWTGRDTDPLLELLWERGLEHERRYVESLNGQGLSSTDLKLYEGDRDTHVEETLKAMRQGVDVIVQGALRDTLWFGVPDILRRVDRPSALGTWSYEVADTKLAMETRAGTILQLSLYSSMLEVSQGVAAEKFHVVTPVATHEYRVDDFAAYFRMVRDRLQEAVETGHEQITSKHYPEPVDHCAICQWSPRCRRTRLKDDHLSLVAGAARLHRRELEANGIPTLTDLAGCSPEELRARKWRRGHGESFVRLHDQARLQHASRDLAVRSSKCVIPPATSRRDSRSCRNRPQGMSSSTSKAIG